MTPCNLLAAMSCPDLMRRIVTRAVNAVARPHLVPFLLMVVLIPRPTCAQILMSAGYYSQNFDSLGSSAAQWTNNATLPGWYASKGNGDATNFLAGSGGVTTGGMYSFGVAGVSNVIERALGSLAGSSITYAFGVRFTNDTAGTLSNITVSCLGEQWRSGSTTTPQTLAFSYQVSALPVTNTYSAGWTPFSALNFVSPNLTGASAPLDGNAATNQQVFASVLLTGVTVPAGQELFLRWLDVDDSGFDNALAIDDLSVSFSASATSGPVITSPPQSQTVNAGDTAIFSVSASGNPAPTYQWQFNNADLPDATNATLTLNNVTAAQAGNYRVVISNSVSATNSTATLTVLTPVAGFSLLTYNTHGNFVSDWTTNSAQVQAIGRQVQYLNPDIITFQEIPLTNAGWTHMPEFVAAFRPGYSLATNSGSDGFIRSVILSRWPITRSKSWLDNADLNPFGYTNSNFTRDL
ncbi:MAG: hypothetical protein EPO07_11435, partial [Verrucomicrobia bacterium]